MQEKGLEKQEILKILEKKLKKDYSYDTGSILGSMCTKPFDFGVEVYMNYVSKNLGDPGLFLGTAELEEELVTEIAELFNGNNIIGTFTTGGSEANLIAMRIAKELRPDIEKPEVVVPSSAHISFDKAADLLGIKLKKAKLHNNFDLDLAHFESLKKLNYDIPRWDFSVKTVDSITADPHKMGLGIIPSGGYFLRDSSILHKFGFEIPYLAGGNFKHFHIVGTRSGGTVIAFWVILKSLGINGFKKIVTGCMENTQYLTKRINEIKGLKLATNPVINVVGITTENGESICQIDEELRKRSWMVGKFEELNLIRVVIMPHVQRIHLQNFTEDLEKIVKELKIT